jgi:hypothetical protein
VLSVYTRHRPLCKRTDIHYRRCHCPKWIRGRLEDSGLIRRSARTRSWAKAERRAREMEGKPKKAVTIESAVAARSSVNPEPEPGSTPGVFPSAPEPEPMPI